MFVRYGSFSDASLAKYAVDLRGEKRNLDLSHVLLIVSFSALVRLAFRYLHLQ